MHEPIEILFLGNSFTHGHTPPAQYYNQGAIADLNGTNYGGVPGIFKQFTVESGLGYNVSMEAACGMTLQGHYDRKLDLIRNSAWHIVVLQELSLMPLPVQRGGNPDDYCKGLGALVELLRKANPEVKLFLYETWASPASVCQQGYTGLHQMQEDLRQSILSACDTFNLTGVVRVGEAFMQAVEQGIVTTGGTKQPPSGTIHLWAEDSRHAGAYGSYLAATVFYAHFTGKYPKSVTVARALHLDESIAERLSQIAYAVSQRQRTREEWRHKSSDLREEHFPLPS